MTGARSGDVNGTLIVKLHGEPLLRIENGQGSALQTGRIEWVGDVTPLSVGWRDAPPDAEAVRQWLEHLIPEGEASSVYRRRAEHYLRIHAQPSARSPDTIARLWGNADREYAGAVSFTAEDDAGSEVVWEEPAPERYAPEQLAEALRRAQYEIQHGEKHLEWDPKLGQTSLSGMRGKLGVYVEGNDLDTGIRRPAGPGRLSTHIVKVEDSRENPGEAALESIVQAALAMVGVQAAETRARVFDGLQVIVSKRSDRHRNRDGSIAAVHQEDWAQASGVARNQKFWADTPDPELNVLCRTMDRHGAAGETANVVEAIVACTLLGHTDMHRKNLGILHRRPNGPVRLAPLYDASSASGRHPRFTQRLALPVGEATTAEKLHPSDLHRLVEGTAMQCEEAVARGRTIAEKLPDALGDAIEKCREQDEISPEHARHAGKRIEQTRLDVARRCLGLRTAPTYGGRRQRPARGRNRQVE